jgi:Coenzyme PQQ synthesis protein D (PqqD)
LHEYRIVIVGKKYFSKDDVVFTDLDDGSAVLLHLESKFYYSLNETGCFLWKLLDTEEGIDEEGLLKGLCENFEVDPGRAEKDISEFITELIDQGLIK